MTPHLLILTPSLGRVSLGYRDTFAKVTLECFRRDIKISVSDATDPGHIVHARNVLFAAAVDSDATHAFWWDADVSFEPAALFELFERPEAMICRPYPMRTRDDQAAIDWIDDQNFDAKAWKGKDRAAALRQASQRWTTMLEYSDGKPIWSSDGRLVRVSHCGFGWVLQRLFVVRDLVRHHPRRKDWRDRRFISRFDETENDNGITCGEDVSFCSWWRSRAAAHIWAAPDHHIQNGDHGGRFADYLEAHGLGRSFCAANRHRISASTLPYAESSRPNGDCRARRGGYQCTRSAGHASNHQAHGPDGKVLAEWDGEL